MTPTSSRLLTLPSLLQARRDWPGPELAERLEVSGRTVRRDVERLQLAMRVLMLGVDLEVHEPPELAERLRSLAGRIDRATAP